MTQTINERLLACIEESEVVSVCSELIRRKSVNPPGNEREPAQYAAEYLRQAGCEVELVEHSADRASVLARLKGTGGDRKGILLSAHLDTVPVGVETWKHDPFTGEVAEGKVWGRGTSDMKGGMAALLVAVKAVHDAGVALEGDIVVALTAGEEVDSLGAVALAERPELRNMQALLVAEPSSNEIFVAEKGALWLEIHTHGQTAHGSMPDLGRNAILMMVELIHELVHMPVPFDPHPLLGGFSQSINTINGGVKTNVVPDDCGITIDMRTVPGQDHAAIVRQIEEIIAKLSTSMNGFKATLKVVNDRPPVTTPEDHPAVERFNQALAQVKGQPGVPKGVRYYTDAAAYINLGAPMIICGPGEAGLAHQPNEFVEVAKLVEATKIYALALAAFLG